MQFSCWNFQIWQLYLPLSGGWVFENGVHHRIMTDYCQSFQPFCHAWHALSSSLVLVSRKKRTLCIQGREWWAHACCMPPTVNENVMVLRYKMCEIFHLNLFLIFLVLKLIFSSSKIDSSMGHYNKIVVFVIFQKKK